MSKSPDSALVNTVAECYSVKAVHGTEPSLASQNAESVGYLHSDLESVPAGAQLGLGCGNPISTANLKEGEVVVDLGSGGGIDVFLAASKVGPRGQAIGLDISPEMINRSRKNAAEKGFKPPQVAFVHASLAEPLPIHSNTVDCILSNCVVNLLPGGKKEELLKELHRVLKPGGRLVIDDIVAKRPLSDEIRNDLTAYLNCVAGSIALDEYKLILDNAGFKGPILQETGNDLQQVCSGLSEGDCCNSTCGKPPYDVNEWVASYQIIAKKEVVTEGDDSTPTSPTVLLRWWDAYPKVKSVPEQVSVEELEALIRGSSVAGNLAVIDVRRDDRVGGHVRGSENWHAQTFFDNLSAFLEDHRNTKRVIFYCGSSSGRGPRCAGWYQDYLNDHNVTASSAYVLKGGVKAWLAKYGDQEDLVEV